jgi:hypothetical protein
VERSRRQSARIEYRHTNLSSGHAAHEVNHQENHGEDQQQVNQEIRNVVDEESAGPEQEQNHK